MPYPRQTADFPSHDIPQATRYEQRVVPTSGFTTVAQLAAPPTSVVSGQNVWVRDGELISRYRLSQQSMANPYATVVDGGNANNPTLSVMSNVLGAFLFHDDKSYNQALYPIIGTGRNFYLGNTNAAGSSTLSWSRLSYVSSGGSSIPPALGLGGTWFGALCYSATRDRNLLAVSGYTGGAIYVMPGAQPSSSGDTFFSLLTQAPASVDITAFQNRLVAWNTREISGVAVPQRAQWCVAGEPEDWTGIGSGFEDLVDMAGQGTRIFVVGDQMICASDREIWRGRWAGLPYVFQFSPITRTQGIPYRRAAINTPHGIFWLGYDFLVWNMDGEQRQPFGLQVQQYLSQVLVSPEFAFFTYNTELRQLRLFYLTSTTVYPSECITFDLKSGTWNIDKFNHSFHYGLSRTLPRVYLYGAIPATDRPFGRSELLFTSASTVATFDASALTDLTSTVTEEAVFGPLFAEDMRHEKRISELRFDIRANSASSVSISVSPTLGSSYSETKEINVSASSFYQHSLLTFDVEGRYPTVRLRSFNSGQWRLSSWYAVADLKGRQ